MQPAPTSIFFLRHVWFPLAAFVVAALALEMTNADLWLADSLYALSGHAWTLRDAWATRALIHDGGRVLVGALAVLLGAALVASLVAARLAYWRRGLWYLLASLVVSALAVNVLKRLSHVDCPWDLARYGGVLPYVRNFAPHPHAFAEGACFPAGHASAAYGWLGLYYVARDYAPRWKQAALAAVLALGLVFGVGQQLRGAHFLSHDLWTLGICWGVATVLYLFALRGALREGTARNQRDAVGDGEEVRELA